MTREEAIQHFKEQLDIFGGEHAEAIKVAIEALQNKSRPFGDCSKCIHTYGTLGCCTTVSNEWVYDCEHGMEQYKNTSVPSADRPKGESLLGTEMSLSKWIPLMSDDLISRTEAIEHFMRLSEDESLSPITQTLMVGVSNEIKKLPSADRPKGEWIHSPNGIDRNFIWWVCSECGHKIFSETEKDRREFHAYCGRCGADMRPTERSE